MVSRGWNSAEFTVYWEFVGPKSDKLNLLKSQVWVHCCDVSHAPATRTHREGFAMSKNNNRLTTQPAGSRGDTEMTDRTVELALDLTVEQPLELADALYGVVCDMILILDEQRRIVYANQAFLKTVNRRSVDDIAGMHLGQALGCAVAAQSAQQCGTSDQCENCGAAAAIGAGVQHGQGTGEYRVRLENGDALDLRVTTKQWRVNGRSLILCSLTDVSHEKRRNALERIFFHDIANMAVGIRMASARLCGKSEDPTLRRIEQTAGTLVESIRSQRLLLAAERNELSVHPVPADALEIVRAVTGLYHGHPLCRHRDLCIADSSESVQMVTDKTLLGRVLDNMIKNALEASPPGHAVTVGCQPQQRDVEFRVHNYGCIPRRVQHQIFQRSFSTKGADRGLGTHSIKLLCERYLKGRAGFWTSEGEGTTFFVRCPRRLMPGHAAE